MRKTISPRLSRLHENRRQLMRPPERQKHQPPHTHPKKKIRRRRRLGWCVCRCYSAPLELTRGGAEEGRGVMETVEEDVEEYSWREVVLPHLVPVAPGAEPELERENGERRRGRDLLVAVDFGPNSKHAFDWALAHIARVADTVHLVHAVSSVHNELVYEKSQELMEDLAVEAFKTLLVRTNARIVEGDAGKVICREAERLKPAAVILGTRGRGLIQSVLQGSVSEYCFHNCKAAPVIIVPGKEAGEQSVL